MEPRELLGVGLAAPQRRIQSPLTDFPMRELSVNAWLRMRPIALLLVSMAACGGESRSSSDSVAASPAMASDSRSASEPMAIREKVAGQSAPAAGGAQPTVTAPTMVIRNGSASIKVDSLEVGIAAVQTLASSLGGYVGNATMSAGEQQVRSATIEVKLPSARYDAALQGLTPIGVVESVTSTAEDVGEEFVDVTARASNAKRLEERLITLLATRTGKLEDVLTVERELARVREEIERYDGRLRYLSSRVATSTLTVTVHEPAPLLGAEPGENVILDAFKRAWRNFVGFVAGLISAMGVLVPLGLLGAGGYYVWRRVKRG